MCHAHKKYENARARVRERYRQLAVAYTNWLKSSITLPAGSLGKAENIDDELRRNIVIAMNSAIPSVFDRSGSYAVKRASNAWRSKWNPAHITKFESGAVNQEHSLNS